jgi:hypothetical protein
MWHHGDKGRGKTAEKNAERREGEKDMIEDFERRRD